MAFASCCLSVMRDHRIQCPTTGYDPQVFFKLLEGKTINKGPENSGCLHNFHTFSYI